MKGFNRRGLYRMKQFFESYTAFEFVSPLATQLPQNLFKDPYILEFLDLPDGHSETDLEKALILNLQKIILEIGKGFTYMGNQYRLQVGKKDYFTDLLFYHRDLQCLVLFELKIQEFEPEFLGDTEVMEYAMARNTLPAMIADYETNLIPKKVLAHKLHQLVEQLSKEENNKWKKQLKKDGPILNVQIQKPFNNGWYWNLMVPDNFIL